MLPMTQKTISGRLHIGAYAFRAVLALLLCAALHCASHAYAQNKGTPGKFDFYLLDMPWGSEFCSIKDVSPQCRPQRGFVLHGLWPQNDDGTWPVFCSEESGPADLRPQLDITPDPQLLQHEWDKHGTCSAVGPQRFFMMEREAFRSIAVPQQFQHVQHELRMTPEQVLNLFYKSNPRLPEDSMVVSCKDGRLTAVEACFSKELKPVRCMGLHSCAAKTIIIAPDEGAKR